jgi:hypothetical protein
MPEDEGYAWPCERDGIDTRKVAENPNSLATERTHTEYHNSKSGLPQDPPDIGRGRK